MVTNGGNTTRQSTELAKLKGGILDDTSLVANDLRKARKLLVNRSVEAAAPAKAKYASARDRWFNEQAKLREQIETSYGGPVANIIYSRSSANLVVDRCYVLVARDDPTRGTSCASRLRTEVAVLTARQDSVNAGKDFMPTNARVVVPVDFTTSVRVANSLLERVVDCKEAKAPITPSSVARCPDLQYLQYALNLRVNLVGASQQALEDALAKRQ